MSQAGIISVEADPTVPTSFVTENGTAIPAANVLNVLGASTNVDDPGGIATDGAGNTVTILLTNRLSENGTTIGATIDDLVTLALGATPGTYIFEFKVCGFNSTTPAGLGYNFFGAVRTNGIAATVIGTPDGFFNEDAAVIAADIDLIAVGNNAVLRVTGVAGLTINWSTVGLYTFVS